MDGIAALLNAHRTKALADDDLILEGLLDFAAVLSLSATPPLSERSFAVRAINAYVSAQRPMTEEEEDQEDELDE